MEEKVFYSDICIVGAGPAGAAAALYLHYRNQSCVLIDKAVFPRDKICGDALSEKVLTILNRIDPSLEQRFYQKVKKSDVWGMRLVAPNGCAIDLPMKPGYNKHTELCRGFVSKRSEFDNFLIDEVRNSQNIDFYEGYEIHDIEKTQEGFKLYDKRKKLVVHTDLLLMANGAQSRFSRLYANMTKDEKHLCVGVRAYFKNIKGFHPDGFIELNFMDSLAPGYFWLFSLPDGEANIGIGIRADYLKKRKIKAREFLLDAIKNDSKLKHRFEGAELIGTVEGFPLPLGSKTRKLSGDNYMLLGDAAHLIDPLSGEGIGNGMYSGWIAAEQAIQCLKQQRFDGEFLNDYDIRIKRVLGQDLKLSYALQRIMVFKPLINFFAKIFQNNADLKDALSKMYQDLNLRKNLINPIFWLRFLLKMN